MGVSSGEQRRRDGCARYPVQMRAAWLTETYPNHRLLRL